ncbi:discoidin domain-containing protein [Acetobacter indonesiensis]|uniref:discoidin domain-containing protein n=1 Tax=Acetobacter indonesiensis TaxID=104101 RepID=UPI000A38D175|nr:discoidin domain-containing protein [Acetobacter indonesiensis]
MFDLALGKRASQSSKLPENHMSLTEDASKALSLVDDGSFFHTAAEWFPWWQVDLEQSYLLEKIFLYNTNFWQLRSRLFTILVSEDGENWISVFSKTDHSVFGSDAETAYKVEFENTVMARYVRIRLDNWDFFHLNQVKIFGKPISIVKKHSKITLEKDKKNIVFSTNYNEEDDFLPIYLNNFLSYTPNFCHIYLNFPEDREIPQHLIPSDKRVHVFNGKIKRYKWGGTLLLGHMESYGKALECLGKIDFFCTCASNGLFVKFFNYDETIRNLALGHKAPVGMTRHHLIDVPVDNVPRGQAWVWDNLSDAVDFRNYLLNEANISKISINQIEGLFASGTEWENLYSRLSTLEKCNEFFLNPTQKTLALEEFLPVTFFRRFGSGQFTNICYMLWEPIREITFPDLIHLVKKLPEHMCQVKWFSRNQDSPATAILSENWGRSLLQSHTMDLSAIGVHNRFRNRALTQSFADVVKITESYIPFTSKWHPAALSGRIQWILSTVIYAGDQNSYRDLVSTVPKASDISAVWLKCFNFTHITLQYEAIFAEDYGKTVLSLRSSREGEVAKQHEWGEVHSILFISPMLGENAQVLRLSVKKPLFPFQEQILGGVRRFDGKNDFAWQPFLHEDDSTVKHFYFLRPLDHVGEIWIGIPAFPSTVIDIELSVGL